MASQTKNQKVRAGEFIVFHVGKMAYTVEHNGVVIGTFRALSPAFAYACQRYDAQRIEIRNGEAA